MADREATVWLGELAWITFEAAAVQIRQKTTHWTALNVTWKCCFNRVFCGVEQKRWSDRMFGVQPDALSRSEIASAPSFRKDRSRMIKVKSRGNETAEQLLRRFKKACEKEGLTKDIKRVAYYEKPSEKRRRRSRSKPKIRPTGRGG